MVSLPSDASPNAWEVIDASRKLSRRIEGRLDDVLEELTVSYAQFEILELLTGRRRIQLAVDATRPVREQIARLAPDRRRQLVAIMDDLDDALRPPRGRPWWLD